MYNEEIVRNEMFLALGYYVTESSGHNSEYNAWFRKRPDLIEKYCLHGTGWNPGEYAYILNEYRRRETTWKKEMDEWFEETAGSRRADRNTRRISSTPSSATAKCSSSTATCATSAWWTTCPYGCCVEVPVLASKRGLEPIHVGKMPPQLALLSGTSAQIEEMVVEGSLAGDREHDLPGHLLRSAHQRGAQPEGDPRYGGRNVQTERRVAAAVQIMRSGA